MHGVFAQAILARQKTQHDEHNAHIQRDERGVMRALKLKGSVVVTNHNEPEAVIVPVEEYEAMLRIMHQAESKTASVLDDLRHRFDERLAVLKAADAGDRLRSVMRGPARLGGKVKVGSGY